jgi:hypothetical protein
LTRDETDEVAERINEILILHTVEVRAPSSFRIAKSVDFSTVGYWNVMAKTISRAEVRKLRERRRKHGTPVGLYQEDRDAEDLHRRVLSRLGYREPVYDPDQQRFHDIDAKSEIGRLTDAFRIDVLVEMYGLVEVPLVQPASIRGDLRQLLREDPALALRSAEAALDSLDGSRWPAPYSERSLAPVWADYPRAALERMVEQDARVVNVFVRWACRGRSGNQTRTSDDSR